MRNSDLPPTLNFMKTVPQLLEPLFNKLIFESNDFECQRIKLTDAFEKHVLFGALEQAMGDVTKAAKLSGMGRTSFWDLIYKHGVNPYVYNPNNTLVCPDHTENPQ